MTERAALMLFLSLLAGAAAHFALSRAGRRLPRVLARRRGVMLAGPVPTPRALALGVVVLQTLAWLASAWLATQQFQALREARGEAASRASPEPRSRPPPPRAPGSGRAW